MPSAAQRSSELLSVADTDPRSPFLLTTAVPEPAPAKKPEIKAVAASSVLQRLQQFLPEMARANEQLSGRADADHGFVLEKVTAAPIITSEKEAALGGADRPHLAEVDHGSGKHEDNGEIHMDLLCGVLEEKPTVDAQSLRLPGGGILGSASASGASTSENVPGQQGPGRDSLTTSRKRTSHDDSSVDEDGHEVQTKCRRQRGQGRRSVLIEEM